MNLKEKRIERKMTQEAVAKACGTTQSAYNHYETGRRKPKPEMLKKMASALECTVDELLADPKEGK